MDETTLRGLLAERADGRAADGTGHAARPAGGPADPPPAPAPGGRRRMAAIAAASLGLTTRRAGGPPRPRAARPGPGGTHDLAATKMRGRSCGSPRTASWDRPIQIGHDIEPGRRVQPGREGSRRDQLRDRRPRDRQRRGRHREPADQGCRQVRRRDRDHPGRPDRVRRQLLLDNTVTPSTWPSGTAETPINVGVEPRAIVITPDGRTAYVLSKASLMSSQGDR